MRLGDRAIELKRFVDVNTRLGDHDPRRLVASGKR